MCVGLVFGMVVTSQVQAAEFKTDVLLQAYKSILDESKNLAQLQRGLAKNDLDKDFAHELYNVTLVMASEIEHLTDIALLHKEMANSEDKAKVANLINAKREGFAQTCSDEIDAFNTYMDNVQNTAIIASGVKLREQLEATCEWVQNWK